MSDTRANFEVITDLLWVTEQYIKIRNNLPCAPDFTSEEQARVALNAEIQSVFERMTPDEFGSYEVRSN